MNAKKFIVPAAVLALLAAAIIILPGDEPGLDTSYFAGVSDAYIVHQSPEEHTTFYDIVILGELNDDVRATVNVTCALMEDHPLYASTPVLNDENTTLMTDQQHTAQFTANGEHPVVCKQLHIYVAGKEIETPGDNIRRESYAYNTTD